MALSSSTLAALIVATREETQENLDTLESIPEGIEAYIKNDLLGVADTVTYIKDLMTRIEELESKVSTLEGYH